MRFLLEWVEEVILKRLKMRIRVICTRIHFREILHTVSEMRKRKKHWKIWALKQLIQVVPRFGVLRKSSANRFQK